MSKMERRFGLVCAMFLHLVMVSLLVKSGTERVLLSIPILAMFWFAWYGTFVSGGEEGNG